MSVTFHDQFLLDRQALFERTSVHSAEVAFVPNSSRDTPGERGHVEIALGADAVASEHVDKGLQQDSEIQEARVINVPNVQSESLFPAQLIRRWICAKPVIPALPHDEEPVAARRASDIRRRGPTRLMSPCKTLTNCGNSSRLVLRKTRPSRVTRSLSELAVVSLSAPRLPRMLPGAALTVL